MLKAVLGWLLAGLLAPAIAQASPLLDAGQVPHLGASGRAAYLEFLLQPTPRAFAVAQDGALGWAAAIEDDAAATEAVALRNCQQWTVHPCRIYARDLSVVWPGLATDAPRGAGPALVAGRNWAATPDPRFLWHGAGQARGVYVWAHGRAAGGADSRGSQPQPHVRAFNNAGYDVVRLDRDPAADETAFGAAAMRVALAALRRAGYGRIVVGGQSRGAWNALESLSEPGLADAVIAIAPAAHGPTGSPAHAWALDDLRAVVRAARSWQARVAVVTFAADEYDPDPPGRAVILAGLAERTAALLHLDRPAGIAGHGAGADGRFTRRYARCLLDFAEGRAGAC